MTHMQQHILASAIILALVVVWGIHVFLFPMYTSNPPMRHTKISIYEQALCRGNVKYIKMPIEWRNPCPKYGIVSAVQGGRLGNQIWEYASVWATARRTGLEPFMPRCILKTLQQYFDNLSIPPLSYIGRCTLDIGQVVNSLTQWNSTEQNIIIPRHAAYWSLILMWLDDVRREFTLKPSLKKYAEMRLADVATTFNKSTPTFVGIHVRRTDYVDYLWQKLKVRPAPVRYYLSAMEYFNRKYDNVLFIVASDSIRWCRYNLRSNTHKITFISDIEARGVGKDLAVLAACNHSIIDYGTYGSFAAILAGGETVVYNVSSYFSTSMADVLPNWRIMS
ncbi:galactoside 2-alpha-L-fucosyltransferase 2 isoform X1 [Diachasma alloeum]|uniref:galactoside 2-alpha-L-fucosyltransferase 2 isoform X1 n=1 Tax=Diachasma alloeum TaxID=454923 RepID=UPI0007384EBC|nr:galactoside 2-alpha-L-fucosyltransferase 2 isoform X1 [Diachasma alloeum]XP_015119133.1 galactoside 2-alpha-L-fucosyltransferase 2 isoform X1 [Diachasma alloeum]